MLIYSMSNKLLMQMKLFIQSFFSNNFSYQISTKKKNEKKRKVNETDTHQSSSTLYALCKVNKNLEYPSPYLSPSFRGCRGPTQQFRSKDA